MNCQVVIVLMCVLFYYDNFQMCANIQCVTLSDCPFSETVDIRDLTVCIIRCVYRAALIIGT